MSESQIINNFFLFNKLSSIQLHGYTTFCLSSHQLMDIWIIFVHVCSVLSNSLRPHGLQPTRLLCPWNSPGQNTGMGSLSLLQGIFPTQGSNPGLPHCRRVLYHLSHQGSSRILEWVAYAFSTGSSQPYDGAMREAAAQGTEAQTADVTRQSHRHCRRLSFCSGPFS